MTPHPTPSPFLLTRGPVAALLIHGFTGSPSEMRLLGGYLHDRGLTVSAPLLPGHGTRVEDLNRKKRADWVEHAERAYAEVESRSEVVFVVGESLGALLALQLAARHPTIASAVLLSPAIEVKDPRKHLLPLLKYILPVGPAEDDFFVDPDAEARLWAYDRTPTFAAHEVMKLIGETKPLLPRVRCPTLIMHSTKDPEIDPSSADYVHERIGTEDKRLVFLHDSGHVLALDAEWRTVADHIHRFILEHLSDELRERLREEKIDGGG